MSTRSDYDDVYRTQVGVYAAAMTAYASSGDPEDLATARTASAAIIDACRRLVALGVSEQAASHGVTNPDTIDELMSEALEAVLGMAASFDDSRDVDFARFLSARNSPWRGKVERLLLAHRYGEDVNDAQRKALRAASGAARAHLVATGCEPDAATLQKLVRANQVARAAAAGEDLDTLDRRNRRSGFAAAMADIEALLASRVRIHPDGMEGDGWTWAQQNQRSGGHNWSEETLPDGVADVIGEPATACHQEEQPALDAKTRREALARVTSGHVQYVHLCPDLSAQFES